MVSHWACGSFPYSRLGPGAATLGHRRAQNLTKGTVLGCPSRHGALFGASSLVSPHLLTLVGDNQGRQPWGGQDGPGQS